MMIERCGADDGSNREAFFWAFIAKTLRSNPSRDISERLRNVVDLGFSENTDTVAQSNYFNTLLRVRAGVLSWHVS